MTQMNIDITPDLMKIVQSKISSGSYSDANEVVSVGVRLLFELDEIKNKQIEALNFEIDKGLASLKAGKSFSGDDVYNELIARRKSYTQ